MPDFWRFELEHQNEYKPIDIKSGKQQHFDLMFFFDKIKALKSDYALYMGSETTPPCIGNNFVKILENVLYLVNRIPLDVPNCQFKILRENSLLTNRERETHARVIQENLKGGKPVIRKIKHDSFINNPKKIVDTDKTPNCEIHREISR